MSVKENKALVQRIYKLCNLRELEVYFELFNPGYILHSINGDLSLEQAKQFEIDFFNSFPDIKATLEDIIAEGDKVAVLVTWRGTHKDTGKKVEMTNANVFKIAKGRIVEAWNVTDIRLAQQLGGRK
jgi:predicted ester cyclase